MGRMQFYSAGFLDGACSCTGCGDAVVVTGGHGWAPRETGLHLPLAHMNTVTVSFLYFSLPACLYQWLLPEDSDLS